MNNNQPTVSIITPVYNMEKYLHETFESVLNQGYEDFEFVVVDDCSTDSSKSILEEYAAKDSRVKVYSTPVNSWAHAAGNVGLENAKGKYIYILDSDDKLVKGALTTQVDFMEKHLNVDICGGWFQCFDGHNKLMASYETDNARIRMGMLYDSTLGHGGTIMRRKLIEDHKIRYNTDIYYTHDYHFFTQLAFDGHACFTSLPTPVYLYRIHSGQTSTALNDKQKGFSDKVRLEVLARLGMKDKALSKCHLCFCRKQPQHIENPKKNIPAYFKAMVKANQASSLFDENLFSKYVAEKIGQNLPRMGYKAYGVLLSMPKEFFLNISGKQLLVLCLKALKKPKK